MNVLRVVSLELDEVMSLSDRILVMYEGEIVGELDPYTVITFTNISFILETSPNV